MNGCVPLLIFMFPSLAHFSSSPRLGWMYVIALVASSASTGGNNVKLPDIKQPR